MQCRGRGVVRRVVPERPVGDQAVPDLRQVLLAVIGNVVVPAQNQAGRIRRLGAPLALFVFGEPRQQFAGDGEIVVGAEVVLQRLERVDEGGRLPLGIERAEEFGRVAHFLDLDAELMALFVVQRVEVRSRPDDGTIVLFEEVVGNVDSRTLQLFHGLFRIAVMPASPLGPRADQHHQPGVPPRPESRLGSIIALVAIPLGALAQHRHPRLVGQIPDDRSEYLADEDIPVARRSEFADQPAQFAVQVFALRLRNEVPEQAEARPQPPGSHADLMDALLVRAGEDTGLVGAKVLHAAENDFRQGFLGGGGRNQNRRLALEPGRAVAVGGVHRDRLVVGIHG